MVSKFRMDYGLYAKYREIKHQEKTQIYDADRIGVRINWEHFGKVMEEKNRRLRGDDCILKSSDYRNKNDKFSLKGLFSGIMESLSIDGL